VETDGEEQEAAKAIIAKAAQTDQSITSRVYTRQLFEAEFGLVLDKTASSSGSLSSTDFDILLCYLSRDKPQLCISSTTIKLKSTSESTPQPITEEDTAIANLRTLIPALQSQVSALTDRIATLETTARTAITANRIAQAKTALRSKKLAETTLSTRSATLSQLEETFTAIQTAADQVAMVTAMSASTAVLGSLHAQVGGTEGVEEVVGRLREEMENVDQVGRVIQEGNTGVRVDDEADVEDEFAALEAAERERVKLVEMERKRKREEREAQVTAERLRALDEVEGERNELDKDETWKGEMQAESG
jgi:charged multivesicular body protein 7